MSSALLWLTHRDQVWLVRRPSPGIWAGLWSFPEFADDAELAALTRGWPGRHRELAGITHVLTHRDWELRPHRWCWPDAMPAASRRRLELRLPAGRWVSSDEALELGLPAPVRRWLTDPAHAPDAGGSGAQARDRPRALSRSRPARGGG